MNDLKAFACDDTELYAAASAEQAAELYKVDYGEGCDGGSPRELTDAELDKRHPAFDENERPIEGQTRSVREMLAEHGSEPGWLATSEW
jgi:hypothetical protein